MSSIKEILKANRPNLSEKTLYSYSSTLSSLYKKVFGSNDVEVEKFDTDIDKVIAELESKPASSRRSVYAMLYVLTNNNKYQKEMLDDIKSYTEDTQQQEMSEKQKENFQSQDDIKIKIAELKSNADLIYKKAKKTPKDLQEIQQYILLCLTSGVYIVPRRSLDWCEMKLKNVTDKDNQIEKNYFIFNTYKGSSKKGAQKLMIPKELQAILKKWLAINETDYLLHDVNGNKLTSVKLNQRMNKIFESKTSVNTMRHSYLSSKFQSTIKENSDLAKTMSDMGSSASQQAIYVQKL